MKSLKEQDGKHYLKCAVVMLPTEKATWPNCIWLGRISKQLRLDTSYNYQPHTKKPIDDSMLPQHLYITSDEPIVEGEYAYDICYNRIVKVKEIKNSFVSLDVINGLTHSNISNLRKIIATTDTSLRLPSPSPEFISVYITAYNKGEQIKDIMVEYEDYLNEDLALSGSFTNYRLKIDNSNCITIRKVKDSWTREEVIWFIRQSFYNALNKSEELNKKFTETNKYSVFDKEVDFWIENNL